MNLVKIILLFSAFLLIACERNETQMLRVAGKVFEEELNRKNLDPNVNQEFVGPHEVFSNEEYKTYMWHIVLEYNDTAEFYIRVFRNKTRDYRAEMSYNNKWLFLTPFSSYNELIPVQYKNSFSLYDSLEKDVPISLNNTANSSFIVSEEKILHYLKMGYFNLYYSRADSAIIDFNTQISKNERKGKISFGHGAIIKFNEPPEITIKSYMVPDSIKDYYMPTKEELQGKKKKRENCPPLSVVYSEAAPARRSLQLCRI